MKIRLFLNRNVFFQTKTIDMSYKSILLIACSVLLFTAANAQINPSALIEIKSNEHGFLPPRMTTSDRDNIEFPSDGMIIFNISTGYINYYDVFQGWLALQPIPTQDPTVESVQTVSIPSTSFRPARSSDNYTSGFNQGGAFITSPSIARMTTELPLPIGSTVTSITYFYKDSSSSSEMTFKILGESLTSGNFPVFGAEYDTGVSNASNAWESNTITTNLVVSSGIAYFIDVFSSGWDGNMAVKGVSITYTLPTN